MAYEPTSWSKGDVVTSEKLNKIEQGIANAGGVLRVMSTENEAGTEATLGKTWQEIFDVFVNGGYAYICDFYEDDESGSMYVIVGLITSVNFFDGKYKVIVCFNGSEQSEYNASSADGYPVLVYEP